MKYLDKDGLTYFWGKIKNWVNTGLNNKVDKVSGKGLSTNDYTTTEKNKLAGIAAGANKTPVAQAVKGYATNTGVPGAYSFVNANFNSYDDKNSELVATSTGYITIQKQGSYLINVNTLWNTAAANKILWVKVSVNNDTTINAHDAKGLYTANGSYEPFVGFTGIRYLKKGDVVRVKLMANVGGATCKETRIQMAYLGDVYS